MPKHAVVGWQRGFTLVELLVVFAIMATAIAVVPLAFDRLRESAQYRSTLRLLTAELRIARHRSLTGASTVSFVADTQRRSFHIEGQASTEIPEPLQLRATVAATELVGGRATIRFLPDGGATGGSVELVRPSGAGSRIRVDWLTGRITQETLLP